MKRNTLLLRLLVITGIVLGVPMCMYAVTPDEMEEARAITAKIYLRCYNPGSDYLDKVNPKTMGELEGKLKSKEKENIVVFKSISVPGDYASWTKDDLVNYWSRTFYSDPKVKFEAKGYAQKMTEKALSAMKIKSPDEVVQPVATPAADSALVLPDAVTTSPAETQSTQAVLDTLAENIQPVDTEKNTGEGSGNAFYIVLLIVLIIAVVVLIIYAARMFKRQTDDRDDDEPDSDNDFVQKTGPNVNVNIAAPAASAVTGSATDKEVESLRAENAELRRSIDDCKYHLNYVKSEKTELQEQVRQLRAELEQKRQGVADMPKRNTDDITVYTVDEGSADRSKMLYLGRANADGIFVRAERELNSAYSVFRLVSTDGVTGTFTVLTSPVVQSRIMCDARHALTGGCECDFNEADHCSGVETLRGGTAIFDQGRWKVLRRAQVSFV